MRTIALLIVGMVTLAGCATNNSRPQTLWTPQGETVSCINLQQIRSTHVVDDRTINFVMNGRDRMMRSELPFACPTLGFSRAFKHNSRTSQLCSFDTITVIQSGSRGGPRCGLGRFQPMVRVKMPPAQ